MSDDRFHARLDTSPLSSLSSHRLAVAALVLAVIVSTSCTSVRQALLGESESEARAAQLNALQLQVMRFADEYAGRIGDPISRFQAASSSPEDRLAAQQWRLSQATAAYTNASGSNPITNALDMIVLATLSRMVLKDDWIDERYGQRAARLHELHVALEQQAWTLVDGVLSAEHIEQLSVLIFDWRAKNPLVRDVTHVRFDEFARTASPQNRQAHPSRNLFAFLGLDPLGNLDPAVRELALTRQLAERSIYYLQRAPGLLDMQIERLTYQFGVTPEVKSLLIDADRISVAAQSAGLLAQELPDLLARERTALIGQLQQALSSEQGELREILDALRTTLSEGARTSDSVHATIMSLDTLLARFQKPASASQSDLPQPPFDIGEYTRAAVEIGATAQRLEALLREVDDSSEDFQVLSAHAAQEIRATTDHVFWRALQLVLAAALTLVVAALLYRSLSRRICPSH